MKQYYRAQKIILVDSVIDSAYVEVEDGVFTGIVLSVPEGSEVVDFGEAVIAPGLVDTHIHGYMGNDVMDNDWQGINTMSEALLANGVTSWLPTTLTASIPQLDAVCRTIGQHKGQETGAKIQGIFLEGPFFTEKYKGAQNPSYMSDPKIDVLQRWIDLSDHLVRKIAIAPEREGVTEFIQFAKSQGVYVALAHSDATYEQAAKAVDAGANIFVHTYNGMRGLHHREPGMVGAALALDDVYAELISDGHHVHPGAAKVVTRARGPLETVLVTDCMRAGGLGEGAYQLGEFDVTVKDGQARLDQDGNLAGSILRLHEGVRNMIEWGTVTLEDGLRMASYAPAKSVGLEDVCGQIKEGFAADFIVVDSHLNLKATYLNGEKRYEGGVN